MRLVGEDELREFGEVVWLRSLGLYSVQRQIGIVAELRIMLSKIDLTAPRVQETQAFQAVRWEWNGSGLLAPTQALPISCGSCLLRVPKRSSPDGRRPALPSGPTASPSSASFVTSLTVSTPHACLFASFRPLTRGPLTRAARAVHSRSSLSRRYCRPIAARIASSGLTMWSSFALFGSSTIESCTPLTSPLKALPTGP